MQYLLVGVIILILDHTRARLMLKMLADKEKMFQEIQSLENALSKNISAKMVTETRYGDRQGRQGPELCTDKTEIGLNEERVQIDNSTRILTDKFEQTKYD